MLHPPTAAYQAAYIQNRHHQGISATIARLLGVRHHRLNTMVVIRKVSPEQWAYEVNRAAQVRQAQKHKTRMLKFRYYDDYLSKLMPIPLLVGATAIILIIYFYGWYDLGKLALSWIVSITIISTITYHMFKKFEAELG